MLKRKIYDQLVRWQESSPRTAAFIVGARQIGKSTVARAFGQERFEQFIEINFLENPERKELFEHRSAREILTAITAHFRQPVIPGKTLILLDEIQEYPAAAFFIHGHLGEWPPLSDETDRQSGAPDCYWL